MTFRSLIARRYAFSKKRFTFINIISMLAMLGIAFGVAALIIVMSVFNGFSSLVTSILLDIDPHLKIEVVGGARPASNHELRKALASLPQPAHWSFFIQRKAMIESKQYSNFVYVKGIDADSFAGVSNLRKKLVLGRMDVKRPDAVVLGINLSDKLRVLVGDTVTVFSPAGLENLLTDPFVQPIVMRLRVEGIFQSDNKIYDDSYAYISMTTASRLFITNGAPSGVDVRLASIGESEGAKARLQNSLGPSWSVSTWYDLHKDLYSVMKIERWAAFILLTIIVLVAAFNIFASLNMLVIEKQRDIGILATMGATPADIQKIFLFEGSYIGGIGIFLGMLLGLGLCMLQKAFGLIRLDSAFIIPAIPVEVQTVDVVLIAVASLVLTLIAAWYPARKARRTMIIDAIRWE